MGYIALLAKNNGMVINCPIPVNLSRDLTKQPIIKEKVQKQPAPKKTTNTTCKKAMGL
jgi:hypothetical protein